MLVIWSNESLLEFEQITDYIAKDNSTAALKFAEMIFANVEKQLSASPLIGRVGRVLNTYELVVHSAYLIAYTITDETVIILSIRHASRLWPKDFLK